MTTTKNIKIDDILKKYYRKNEDFYFDKASEDVGVWVRDYYAPDGYALADLSGWSNEDEIYERALETYIDELCCDDRDLIDCITNDFAKDEDDAVEIEEYIKSIDYKSLCEIFN
jgi:hypothetical protein